MSKQKYFSVNMNTTEEPKPETSHESKTDKNHVMNSTSHSHSSGNKGIVINQADLDKKRSVPTTVRTIENADELFENKREKFTGKDLKLVLVPGIILIIIAVLNEIFGVPFVLNKTVTYVLNGNLDVKMTIGTMKNEELTALAGLIAISSYCIFSISLLGFSIYNIFKRVYVKKDIMEIAGKILLYAFLIGFLIALVDSLIPIKLTKIIVKITTIGLHTLK